ncbi:hypothetical protein ACS0Y3_16855 [Burkholderia gladioli]|uniref:hypothetical protein n=1 Tax=Burkholderia gladioli TaxID=28095 RepID=UPI003F79CB59
MNQTATIQCDTAETIISSFVVRPDPARAVIFQSQAAEQYLVDGPSSSTKAANGDLLMMFEQVAVNGQSKPFAYWNPGGPSANVGYTGVQTGSIQSGYSYATVVWRPVLCCSGYSTPIGQPGTGNAWYAYAEIAIAF